MLGFGPSWVLLAVAVVGPASAQFTNWVDNQIATEISALIRDMIYLDGGDIWWMPHLDDGRFGAPVDNGNNGGLILNYNLSTPFNSTTNVTEILLDKAMSKARGGSGNSNGAAPNYYDGAMLANDAQFFLYGGALLRNDDLYDPPDEDEVLSYQAYQYGPDKPTWQSGFDDATLDDRVTRYIAYGGAVNAPSENLAWYFSGLASPTRGPIYTNSLDDKAVNVSNTLITLNMEEQLLEEWTNTTLPPSVKGRANPEVVWVPVGEKGILVVLGGVVYPEWAGRSHKSANETASEEESPEFMQTIDIYDIANNKWYKQETEDGPGALTRGCAVVAPASDYSSFNIYYYGGFDGINPTDPFKDDVWALSIPSFTWTKIYEGKDIHARAGHKCFMPYLDQMMVLGGYTTQSGSRITCLDGGPVVMFNLTSGEWMDGYDPAEFSDYGVHEKIQSQIGGDAAGSATATAPASGWATSALGEVFDTEYDTDKITTYWPYDKATATGRPDLDDGSSDDDGNKGSGGGSGLPKWVAPVLGVVLGLMLVTGCLVVFCLWRRRKIFKNRSSDDGTEDAGNRIISWMRGQNTEKAPTVTTSTESPASPEMEEAVPVRAVGPGSPSSRSNTPVAPAEMADTQLVELADQPPLPSPALSGPESPTAGRARVASDVSGVSDGDTAQLRNMGASPVSPRSDDGQLPVPAGKAESDVLPSPPLASPPADATPVSPTPVSPPTAGESSGDDYLSARPPASPLRKSMFVESEEDMGRQK
ncbi:hypothetical protein ACJ41O_007826 [Fusarium nematophilum]